MWQIDNRTPFAVEQGWIRDRNGAELWLVVVKATFDVRDDGSLAVSEKQPAPCRVPEHHGEPGKSSIRYESDFLLTKSTTDVIVVGHAHAPGGQPVTQLDVGLRVGPVQKRLKVFGDRSWGLLGPSEPAPFVAMPLVYERAFGGVDTQSDTPEKDWEWRNPVGCGFAIKSAHLKGVPVPNIEWPDQLISSWDDRPPPAGFGAMASHWRARAELAGTYDAHWEATRQPLLPEDCSDKFFQCAPLDQQTPQFLGGGEPVNLLNLSPRGRLDFVLPQIDLLLQSQFFDGEQREHEAPQLHTVILEPDFPRVSLVWHSSLACHAKVFKLERTRVEWRRAQDEEAEPDTDNLLDHV